MSSDNGVPSLEDFLGLRDKAAIDADRIRNLAISLQTLNRLQTQEGLEDSDVIPASNPEQKTFADQREVIEEAYQRLVKQAKSDDYWALVEQLLTEAKSK